MTSTAGMSASLAGRTSPLLLGVCGALGLLGALALFATNGAASALAGGHDWTADTVSKLAAGPRGAVQDAGLYLYAAGLVALAMAAAHVHPGGGRWSLGALCLAVLAAVLTAIAARPGYRLDAPTHAALVYLMGALWLAAPLLMARGLARVSPRRGMSSAALGLAWGVGSAGFLLTPEAWQGLVERLLGVVTMAWVALLSATFLEAARRAGRGGEGALARRDALG
jgi:hypothetical protein